MDIKESLVPKLRFKGFAEPWEQRKLEDITEIIDGDRGTNYPNGDDFQAHGHTLFLSAANITKEGFNFDASQYITKEKSESLGNGKVQQDDIVLTSRGSIGHIAWYNEKIHQQTPNARINSGMLLLRPKENTFPGFVEQFLKSAMGRKQIDLISFGSAQPQLTKKDVANYDISYTGLDEQAELSNFFSNIDNALAIKLKQHHKTQTIKKTMLEKMFPKKGVDAPEIRIDGFVGPWEKKQCGDAADFYNNLRIPVTELLRETGNTPYYGANGIQGYINGYTHSGEFVLVAEDGASDISNYPIRYVAGKIWVNNHAHELQGKPNETDTLFLSYALSIVDYHHFLVGGTRVKLNARVLNTIPVHIPSIPEQTAISNFFHHLDNLLKTQTQEIQKLKTIKTACMNKMLT
ncbi:MAG: restriction endonuclease subunit S [Defluviitaleaceae bacterium]|nr:restriction endonuclease subunit S [Defluviitaleaceae bacterium]